MRTLAAAILTLSASPGAAQFSDEFGDGNLDGWTVTTTSTGSVEIANGKLRISGTSIDTGMATVDETISEPTRYANGSAAVDIDLDVNGRPVVAGFEVRGDPSSDSGLFFSLITGDPGGPDACISYYDEPSDTGFTLAAPAIPFDLSRVRVIIVWSFGEYTMTVFNRNNSSQRVTFTVEGPTPFSSGTVSLLANPVPGPASGAWSVDFDNFSTTPGNLNPCPADTNGDGMLSPADYNGWIIAFNTRSPACDQNGDGICTPADFNGWIINFNKGCP